MYMQETLTKYQSNLIYRMTNAGETRFSGAEGISHKFAIYDDDLRQKDRILTKL